MSSPETSGAVPGSFEFQPRTRVVFGENAIERVGQYVLELGGKRVLLVTDPGIKAAGHAGRVQTIIEAAGVNVTLFDRVQENPTTRCVQACVDVARQTKIDLLVGLGGGSSMDTAKGCNFILTNGGEMKDYWGVGKARLPMLPLIAVPTTGGTGSECQSFALISDELTHQKMACGDSKAAARIALLDPLLTLSQPAMVTACTGIDAIAHSVETAVTRKRTAISFLFSREAFKLTVLALPRVLASPDDLEARGSMLLGAAWAGTAIENSMLGAAHSAANPLTAHYDIAHGLAVGLMLPHVIRFNSEDSHSARAYEDLAIAAGLVGTDASPMHAAERLAQRLERIVRSTGLPHSLPECGVPRESISQLSQEAAAQWTAQFNPRPVSAADFEALYLQAFHNVT
jgi:alcohol dehydrogenase